jgi:hypothetical protein
MWRARYLPEMSLPTLSLKFSNYMGQELACGITTSRAQIARKSDNGAFNRSPILSLNQHK